MSRPRKTQPPAVLNMDKVRAALARRQRADTPPIDMDRVTRAIESRRTAATHGAPAAHLAFPAEDSARRKPISRLTHGCTGFGHPHFLQQS